MIAVLKTGTNSKLASMPYASNSKLQTVINILLIFFFGKCLWLSGS